MWGRRGGVSPWGSTYAASAPRTARSMVARDPAIPYAKSSALTPSRIPAIAFFLVSKQSENQACTGSSILESRMEPNEIRNHVGIVSEEPIPVDLVDRVPLKPHANDYSVFPNASDMGNEPSNTTPR